MIVASGLWIGPRFKSTDLLGKMSIFSVFVFLFCRDLESLKFFCVKGKQSFVHFLENEGELEIMQINSWALLVLEKIRIQFFLVYCNE